MEKEELAQIISEYEQQNKIECITEEELLDLIPESELWPNVYLPSYGRYSHSGIDIPDYDYYLLGKGINLIEGDTPEYLEHLEELQQTQDGIDLGDADRIDESEWECSLVEDLEYYLSLRTETVEVYVTDACEAIKW